MKNFFVNHPQLKLEDLELDKNNVRFDEDEDGELVELGQGRWAQYIEDSTAIQM